MIVTFETDAIGHLNITTLYKWINKYGWPAGIASTTVGYFLMVCARSISSDFRLHGNKKQATIRSNYVDSSGPTNDFLYKKGQR